MRAAREPGGSAAIVLAAGASRRMGRNKMLLELEGEPLVRRAARRALASGCTPVIVVIGHQADSVRGALDGVDCECVLNPDFQGPTSGSLHAGLRCLPPLVEAAVVLLADMVHVSERMVRAVVAAGRGDAVLVVSRYGDVTAPPLLFRRTLFAELLAWDGEGCGKAVVQRHRDEALFLEWPAGRLTDIDTPEDFQTVTGIIGSL